MRTSDPPAPNVTTTSGTPSARSSSSSPSPTIAWASSSASLRIETCGRSVRSKSASSARGPERALRRVEWVHVAPLLRDDFAPATLERIAYRRRVLLDGHGLVRPRRVGALELDGDFDRSLLRHVSILKLAEEEAQTILGGSELEKLRELGVPEVVVTFGAGGSLVLTREAAVRVTTRPARGDPTGAGDAFSVAYLSARAGGHRPISAARRASALVSALLSAPPR